MNSSEALKALQAILADPVNLWITGGKSTPDPAKTHALADTLLTDLIEEHLPDSEEFLELYDEMRKWYS